MDYCFTLTIHLISKATTNPVMAWGSLKKKLYSPLWTHHVEMLAAFTRLIPLALTDNHFPSFGIFWYCLIKTFNPTNTCQPAKGNPLVLKKMIANNKYVQIRKSVQRHLQHCHCKGTSPHQQSPHLKYESPKQPSWLDTYSNICLWNKCNPTHYTRPYATPPKTPQQSGSFLDEIMMLHNLHPDPIILSSLWRVWLPVSMSEQPTQTDCEVQQSRDMYLVQSVFGGDELTSSVSDASLNVKLNGLLSPGCWPV